MPAFSGLFAPYWRSDARGAIVGLSRFHTAAHLARATLEAICYQSCDVVEAMEADAGMSLTCSRSTAASPRTRSCMQMQADVLGIDVSQAGGRRDHRAGRRLRRRAWPSASGTRRTSWGELARGPPLDPADRRRTSARPGYAGWQKAVQRTLDWVEV